MNRKTHDTAGTLIGLASVLLNARNPNGLILDLVGAAIGGRVFSHAPDFLEPPKHPRHRSTAHSVAAVVVLAAFQKFVLPKVQRALRAAVERLTKAGRYVWASVFRVLSGIAGAATPGYLSHLALDATTPRRLPLLK